MLSKLLSKVGNKEAVSLQDGATTSGKNEKGLDSSKKVFQSLLQALQGDGEEGSPKLVQLAGDDSSQSKVDSEKTDKVATVLGGQFSIQRSVANAEKKIGTQSTGKESLEMTSENSKQVSPNSEEPNSKVKAEVEGSSDNSNKTKKVVEANSKQDGQLKGAGDSNSNPAKELQKKVTGTTSEAESVASKTGNESTGNTEGSKVGSATNSKSESSIEGVTTQNKEMVTVEKENAQIEGKAQAESSQNEGVGKSQTQSLSLNESKGAKNAIVKPANSSKETAATPKVDLQAEHKTDGEPQRRSSENVKNKQAPTEKRPQSIFGQQLVKQAPAITANVEQGTVAEQADHRQKFVDNFSQKNSVIGSDQKGFEFKSLQVEKMQRKQKNGDTRRSRDEKRKRNSESGRIGFSARSRQEKLPPLQSLSSPELAVPDSGSQTWSEDIIWEEQLSESSEVSEKESSKKAVASSTMRLGQMPVANISLRKQILPGLSKTVSQAASEAQKTPEQWQKHNFVLDDGKNIQLSVRESKGVLHVKMGSLNLDLSKLLQQNLQEIRDHLKQEFGTDVNLQFENQGQQSSEFAEDSDSSNNEKNYPRTFTNNELTAKKSDQVNLNSVRSFGYNQMEWTA